MAGMDNSVKIIGLLVLYFALLGTILTLVSDLTGDDLGITTTNLTTGYYCGDPRTVYDGLNPDGIPPESINGPNQYFSFASSLECGNTKGVRSETDCLTISGCSWESSGILWWESDYTCDGHTNYSINYTTDFLFNDRYAYTDGEKVSVCDYPTILTNQTLCEAFSCDWRYVDPSDDTGGFDSLDPNANINRGVVGNVMSTIGGMFTLRFDYGFTDDNASRILNFLLFWIPFIILLIVLYQLIPFI